MVNKIMVVDDDLGVIYTIKNGLKSLDSNYEIITAENGKKCLELLENNQIPDLIILDIMMPEMSGWDVAAKIKENPKWNNIPIIFLTAKGDTMSVGMGGLAAEDYIVKPFNVKDLKNRVEQVLNK